MNRNEFIKDNFICDEDVRDSITTLFSRYSSYRNLNKKKLVFRNTDVYINKFIKKVPKKLLSLKVDLVVILLTVVIGIIIKIECVNDAKESIVVKIIWLVMNIFIHELGHAAICKSYGREIIEAGFKLNYGFPTFFINTTDICMEKRSARIQTSIGGVFGNSILLIVSALCCLCTKANFSTLKFMANLSLIFILFNLIPFLKLDGYYILSDILNIINKEGNYYVRLVGEDASGDVEINASGPNIVYNFTLHEAKSGLYDYK